MATTMPATRCGVECFDTLDNSEQRLAPPRFGDPMLLSSRWGLRGGIMQAVSRLAVVAKRAAQRSLSIPGRVVPARPDAEPPRSVPAELVSSRPRGYAALRAR